MGGSSLFMPNSVRAGTDIGCPEPKIVVDSGFVVDCGYWSSPDQPPSPDPPRKWDAWGCRGRRGESRWGRGVRLGSWCEWRGVCGRRATWVPERRPAPCGRCAGLGGAVRSVRGAGWGRAVGARGWVGPRLGSVRLEPGAAEAGRGRGRAQMERCGWGWRSWWVRGRGGGFRGWLGGRGLLGGRSG